eukprot:TRINITY_DN124429_c0_g1_i1.p1 TRINITY_DN124429_c0_g1~~TRINITY_DN124429_c0_g1_i1.p1  ORF type:complete len:661 (-),score=181.79 TRINITY_DN124429_c0_g1_i1:79-2061(-)
MAGSRQVTVLGTNSKFSKVRRRAAGAVVLAAGAAVVTGSWCKNLLGLDETPAGRFDAFVGGGTQLMTQGLVSQVLSPAARSEYDRSSRHRELTIAKAGKGFGAGAAAATAATEVEEPEGGWPTISVVMLSPASKYAKKDALAQLQTQDYPADKIMEVILAEADETGKDAPSKLKPKIKDFVGASGTGAVFNFKEELKSMSGDYVALWSDDQVAPASRLKTQVAQAMKSNRPTVLKQNWFFNPEAWQLEEVTEWPISEFQEAMDAAQDGQSMPDSFAPMMIYAEPLSLCGKRETMTNAASRVKSSTSPNDELKELLLELLSGDAASPPQIMDNVDWAVLRQPPAVAKTAAGKPPAGLREMVRAAWPSRKEMSKSWFEDALKDIQQNKLQPAAAIGRVLAEDAAKPLTKFELKKITKTIADTLVHGSGVDVSAAVAALQDWFGLKTDMEKSDIDKAVRNFPAYFACFKGLRSYVAEDADLVDTRVLGDLARGLVQLARRMWAADSLVTEVLVKITAEEMYGTSEADMPAPGGADIVGTLGLRRPLEGIAYAALDIPDDATEYPVSQLVSLAWGLSEAQVQNAALQNKVAKLIVRGSTKMTPPDIGYLFHALNNKEWFKDKDAIAYLTEAMLARAQELKRNDAGLRKTLADAVAAGTASGESR